MMKRLIEAAGVALALSSCGGPECDCPSAEITDIRHEQGDVLRVTARVSGNPGCSAAVSLKTARATLDTQNIKLSGDPKEDTVTLEGVVDDPSQAQLVTDGEWHESYQTGPSFRDSSGSCDDEVQAVSE